jgi:AcrR family transcriptional regulator
MGDGVQQLRADAQRNRDHIVAAAQTLFLDRGVNVPLEDIAAAAGVGIGTLYRRFPDRDALILATNEASLTRLADLAEAAWTEEPDAGAALARFLRACIVDVRLGALPSTLEPKMHADMRAAAELVAPRQKIIDLLTMMITTARDNGLLRPDVGLAEIALIMTLQVYGVPDAADPTEGRRRVVEIVLDGLRLGATSLGSPLPDPELQPRHGTQSGLER